MRGRAVCVLFLLLAAWPVAARGQHFSFGFDTGGHHRHGHHHCHDRWYGFDFYRPRYVYPPPVVYAQPPVTYVYPAPAVQVVQPLSQAQPRSWEPSSLASSSESSGSAVRLNALPTQQQQRSDVVLRNPAENAGAVAFRVQDQVDAELGPGKARTWSDRASLTVEFDRGGNFGATRKFLRPGAYEFVVSDEGWDLVAAVKPTGSGRSAALQKNALPARR